MIRPTAHTRALVRRQLLRFGHDRFLPHQRDIMVSILVGRPVLAVLGTGGGKSLCFQLPALVLDGLTVVVSPTISLAIDQVTSFNARFGGDRAAYLNSTLSPTEIRRVLHRVASGSLKLLYVAPERLFSTPFHRALESIPISLLVVDEAHCAYQDSIYREHYLRIGEFARRLGVHRIAAFTATAPRGYKSRSLVRLLGLKNPHTFRASLNRRNLYYGVSTCSNNGQRNVELARQLGALYPIGYRRGIVYCARRRDVPDVLRFVESAGFSATWYHGQPQDSRQRKKLQRNLRKFLAGGRQVLVATKAFEVGIDIPDIRFVICFNAPASLDALVQMWGRAGRDGLQAYCSLLTAPQDGELHRVLLENSIQDFSKTWNRLPRATRNLVNPPRYHRQLEADFQRVLDFAHDRSTCRRRSLLASQNRLLKKSAGWCCDVCNRPGHGSPGE